MTKWLTKVLEKCATLGFELKVYEANSEGAIFDSELFLKAYMEIHTLRSPVATTLRGACSAVPKEGVIIFICPEKPVMKVMKNIAMDMPENWHCQFVVQIRPSTTAELEILLRQSGGEAKIDYQENHICIQVKGPDVVPIDDPYWDELPRILCEDKYVERWDLFINGQKMFAYNSRVAEEIKTMHKVREEGFTDDDMLNLHIMLEASHSVADFEKMLNPPEKP
jgi:hypothetical protein